MQNPKTISYKVINNTLRNKFDKGQSVLIRSNCFWSIFTGRTQLLDSFHSKLRNQQNRLFGSKECYQLSDKNRLY